jgi:hypothetical protein
VTTTWKILINDRFVRLFHPFSARALDGLEKKAVLEILEKIGDQAATPFQRALASVNFSSGQRTKARRASIRFCLIALTRKGHIWGNFSG